MKKFFNVIPGKNKTACILLYGDIGAYDGSAADIVTEIVSLQAEYDTIDLRINSYGGDVYAGIAIFNALHAAKANIHIYIDGVAASMAAIIALCGQPLEMSKYARLMLHSVSSGVYGTKEDLSRTIEEITSLEATLSDIIAPRLGLSPSEVRDKYFDGEDHWITAVEALNMGLVDAIYDVEDIAPAELTSPKNIYTIFNNRLSPQNNTKMNIEEIRKRPRFANCANDADVAQVIDDLETTVTELQEKNDEYKEREKAALEALDNELLDAAEADGRISSDQRTTFKALLNSAHDDAAKVLAALKPKNRISAVLGGQGNPQNSVSAWDQRMQEIKTKNNQ